MAWRRPDDKPLSESMMVSLLTKWVKNTPVDVLPYPSFVVLSGIANG